jgi:hypothetical protein
MKKMLFKQELLFIAVKIFLTTKHHFEWQYFIKKPNFRISSDSLAKI